MFDDSKNASSWEVVGGKSSSGKKSKTDQKKKDGASKNNGSQPAKVVKVDELGMLHFSMTTFQFHNLNINRCIFLIILQLLHWILNMHCW